MPKKYESAVAIDLAKLGARFREAGERRHADAVEAEAARVESDWLKTLAQIASAA